jgi:FAD/FMN-containing dehydrogenase
MTASPVNRRRFLGVLGAAGALGAACRAVRKPTGEWVNDVHSQLNRTRVAGVVEPRSTQSLRRLVKDAAREGRRLAVAGGRHASGGQQFSTGNLLVDMRRMDRVLQFDRDRGMVEVEAGLQWPELVQFLLRSQRDASRVWTIRQKQTGTDRLTIGGALASNIHGRGLTMKPFIDDVEEFTLVDPEGEVRRCSRTEHPELFRLAAGGYGLLGPVSTVKLRLAPRRKMRRKVEIIRINDLLTAFDQRIAAGFVFGDFQYAIDPQSADFLNLGVFSCYQPVPEDVPIPSRRRSLQIGDWEDLVHLAHTQPARAFEEYANYYRSTDGQAYWSDLLQFSNYQDDYHRSLDARLGVQVRSTEVLTEVFVPRSALGSFMEAVREDFRRHQVRVIYGTIRLIEKDEESFLAWAREPWACVIFNLHTVHTTGGLQHTAEAFRRLIDLAIDRGGSYYLTYHRFARRDQTEACHPRLREFLAAKQRHDPHGVFQSDWFAHLQSLPG